jgi:hypothetical protein
VGLHRARHLTTAFTCRAGCKQRDVSKNRNAGPVKCIAWLAAAFFSIRLDDLVSERLETFPPCLGWIVELEEFARRAVKRRPTDGANEGHDCRNRISATSDMEHDIADGIIPADVELD